MADETKLSPTQPRPKGSRTVKAAEADADVVEVIDVVEETPEPVAESPAVEEIAEDAEVEAMGKRGRKSKADIAADHKRTREDIESNFGNLIDHEPWKADFYREELRQVLTDLKLI
jgi:hypothetical protein